jgi:hypothetical protein
MSVIDRRPAQPVTVEHEPAPSVRLRELHQRVAELVVRLDHEHLLGALALGLHEGGQDRVRDSVGTFEVHEQGRVAGEPQPE